MVHYLKVKILFSDNHKTLRSCGFSVDVRRLSAIVIHIRFVDLLHYVLYNWPPEKH